MPVVKITLHGNNETPHTVRYAKTLDHAAYEQLRSGIQMFNRVMQADNIMLGLTECEAVEKGQYTEGPFGQGYWLENGELWAGPIQRKDGTVLKEESMTVSEWENPEEKYKVYYWFFAKLSPDQKKFLAAKIDKDSGG